MKFFPWPSKVLTGKILRMKAIVVGATGLVGGQIVRILCEDSSVEEVKVFSRRKLNFIHPKLNLQIVNFDDMKSWAHEIKGDVLFSSLGTTIKVAGTKEAQYKVDHDYQLHVAEAAAQNGVGTFVLISSVNADSGSPFFYLRMKGELDEKVSRLGFTSINILRPGPLHGVREKSRPGEIFSHIVLKAIPDFFLSPGMRPVSGELVALNAIKAAKDQNRGINHWTKEYPVKTFYTLMKLVHFSICVNPFMA